MKNLKPQITVIVPTCRETFGCFTDQMVLYYPKCTDIEYLVVDSQTNEDVKKTWNQKEGWKVIDSPSSHRAQRLQVGFEHARGDFIIFHHPRSLLEPKAFQWLLTHKSNLKWGGFTHQFDHSHWLLKWTSFYSNRIRPRTQKVIYLDHCFYFFRHLLDQPIPNTPIFEDTEISKILARHERPQILPFLSQTSAIRFNTNGIFKQAMMNQKLKLEYHWGKNREKMNRHYEKGLNLND